MATAVRRQENKKNNNLKQEDLFYKLGQARKTGGSVIYVYEEMNAEGKKEKIGTVVTELGYQFLYTEKGNNRPGKEIISILQDSCHDFGADYFIVQTNG